MEIILKLPYISTFIIVSLAKLTNAFYFNIIPGHPWISFLTIVAGAEIVSGLVINGTSFGKAYSCVLNSLFVSLILMMILKEFVVPDSVQFCILLNCIYAVFTFCLVAFGSLLDIPTPELLVTKIISFIVAFLSGVLSYYAIWFAIWDNYERTYGSFSSVIGIISLIIGFIYSLMIGMSTIVDNNTKASNDNLDNSNDFNDYNPSKIRDLYKADEHSGLSHAQPCITKNGIKVNSKSEAIIANLLVDNNVPFEYEKEIILDGQKMHPDFTLVEPLTKRIWYWEHLGGLANLDYRNEWKLKKQTYENNGIYENVNLITTTEEDVVNTYKINEIIKNRFADQYSEERPANSE